MTEKLFYEDAFLKEFSGTVMECREENGKWVVLLDRTAFYPEGGGQPADQGTLGKVRVFDTREKMGISFTSAMGRCRWGKLWRAALIGREGSILCSSTAENTS